MLINADIGEQTGNDSDIAPFLDMANIACGYHASNNQHMSLTVKLAIQHEIKIGAHPSYKDRTHFGRVSFPHSVEQIMDLMYDQVNSLRIICDAHSTHISYIKPHGALYNDMMTNAEIYTTLILSAAQHQLPLMILAQPEQNPLFKEIADRYEVPLLYEVFADRSYTDEGFLVNCSQTHAVHTDPAIITHQALQLAEDGTLTAENGKALAIHADSICLHGDNPASVLAASGIHKSLHS